MEITLPETNIFSEKGLLELLVSYWDGPFSRGYVGFGEGTFKNFPHPFLPTILIHFIHSSKNWHQFSPMNCCEPVRSVRSVRSAYHAIPSQGT